MGRRRGGRDRPAIVGGTHSPCGAREWLLTVCQGRTCAICLPNFIAGVACCAGLRSPLGRLLCSGVVAYVRGLVDWLARGQAASGHEAGLDRPIDLGRQAPGPACGMWDGGTEVEGQGGIHPYDVVSCRSDALS